jgi:hypothetical protein
MRHAPLLRSFCLDESSILVSHARLEGAPMIAVDDLVLIRVDEGCRTRATRAVAAAGR